MRERKRESRENAGRKRSQVDVEDLVALLEVRDDMLSGLAETPCYHDSFAQVMLTIYLNMCVLER